MSEQIIEIQEQSILDSFSKHKVFKGIQWREHQLEVIKKLIFEITNFPNRTIFLDAPTGSGKSIIASAVSYYLNKNFLKNGYIITSDKQLQNQYEEDFAKWGMEYGSVRGIDNYLCSVNGMKHSLGDCHINRVNRDAISKLSCYSDCPYFSARDYAAQASTSLLNYNYFLIVMNYINEKGYSKFESRDFTFCDEGHKAGNIVQSHFSPRINNALMERIIEASRGLQMSRIDHRMPSTISPLISKLYQITNNQETLEVLGEIRDSLARYNAYAVEFKESIQGRLWHSLSREFQSALKAFDFIKDVHCKIEDYVDFTQPNEVVKTQSDKEITYNTLNERKFVQKFLLWKSKATIFMSATLGNVEVLRKNYGVSEHFTHIQIPHSFNYEKSPIHFFQGLKLSAQHIEQNFPRVAKGISLVVSKRHKDHKGIIHTSSFANAQKLYTYFKQHYPELANRAILYGSQGEDLPKNEALAVYLNSQDKILIGPSLTEGINLPDGDCRFNIILKVPFLSLGNTLYKIKSRIMPEWYNLQAIIAVEQMIGRGIRHKDDWCVSYIFDASFERLYDFHSKTLPKEFMERFKFWDLTKLV